MFEIVSEHQFWTAVVIYWMFSAAVEIHARQEDRSGSATEEILLEIVRIGIRAYEQHTGEPLDPALIRAQAPL